MLSNAIECYRMLSGGLENVFESLARVRKAGTGMPKPFELSVADRRYNKPERDRAKRSGLRIFMLGRMFLPKTLRHDRTHRQVVLMTSVRAANISRKDFVLQEVRQKNWSRSFSDGRQPMDGCGRRSRRRWRSRSLRERARRGRSGRPAIKTFVLRQKHKLRDVRARRSANYGVQCFSSSSRKPQSVSNTACSENEARRRSFSAMTPTAKAGILRPAKIGTAIV